jgi:exosortase/archaeosortase family protein
VAAAVSHLALHTPTFGSIPNATFFLGVGSPHAFGLVVTNDCTSAITTTVVLAVTAILALVSRTGIGRLAAAAVVASATFAAINLARLVMIAAATRQWGLGAGFHWSHVWGGTFVTVLGSVVTAVAYLHVLGMRRHPERPRPTPSSPDRTA